MIELLKNLYQGKTVLVTGHTGFKGTWLSMWLRKLGATVVGYALGPPSQPNLCEALNLEDRVIHIHGDIRNRTDLQTVFSKYNPQMIFHLAAQTLVHHSYRDPHLSYETNVMGTVNVLEAVRQTESVRVVVNVTSDKCYENQEWMWGYRENDPIGGHDPYSSSKGCAELVHLAYLRSFFLPEKYGVTHQVALASVRAGNVIGGGDWGEDRLLPDCIKALTRGEEILIRYPKAMRPWQHVLEPLGGYLLLGAKLWADGAKYDGAWNFGPSESEIWTVEEVVRSIIHLWGHGSYRIDKQEYFHEAHCLKLDCSKAMTELGWRPKYDINQAIKLTLDWYRKFYEKVSKEEIMDFTVEQIERYEGE